MFMFLLFMFDVCVLCLCLFYLCFVCVCRELHVLYLFYFVTFYFGHVLCLCVSMFDVFVCVFAEHCASAGGGGGAAAAARGAAQLHSGARSLFGAAARRPLSHSRPRSARARR